MKKFTIIIFFLSICLIALFNFLPKSFIVSIVPNNFYKYIKSNMPQNLFAVIQVFLDNQRSTSRLNNDYNSKFLPSSQFLKLNLTKIKLNFDEESAAGYAPHLKSKSIKTFFIESVDEKIFIMSKQGKFFYTNIQNLNKNKIFKIENNLKDFVILDLLTSNKSFYISAFNKKDKCKQLIILKSNFGIEKSDFKVIKKFGGCFESIQAGKMVFYKKNENILISTAADILKNDDESDDKPQNLNSSYGKILLLDTVKNTHKIFSYGHRNILGLYAKNDLVLATENGPAGGDEINKIKLDYNYGWPIASYGEKYNHEYKNVSNYKKNHEDYNFVEPVFSFVPSIGISEIVEIDNNFSPLWHNNYLVASLNSRHLFRLKFDKNISSLKFYEKIFINERIRDLLYLSKEKVILLALEESGSIGILRK
tara:strand:- start:31099 stop:32364 length:1266 start_codon:yes stop_codon:yes gene_type:complete